MKMKVNRAEIEQLPLPDPLPSTSKGGKDALVLHELIICALLLHLPVVNNDNPVTHHHYFKLMRDHHGRPAQLGLPNRIQNLSLVLSIQR